MVEKNDSALDNGHALPISSKLESISVEEYKSKPYPVELEENDQKLKNWLANEKILEIKELRHNQCEFTANSHVGTAPFSNFSVEIKPKITDLNVVKLMYYLGDELDIKTYKHSKISFQGEKNRITELIISIFVENCKHLVQQGLVKSYNLREDDLPFLRGKLLISQQILNHAQARLQFACEYDEFEYNNLENQIILFCLEQCYSATKDEENKKDIRRLVQRFSNLVDSHEIKDDDFKRINYNRMNKHYKTIHKQCRLIVNKILPIGVSKGKYQYIYPFFFNMNTAFEQFVRNLFHDYYPGNFNVAKGNYESWKCDTSELKNGGKSEPDILITKGDMIHAIIDVKYKKDDKKSSADLYQMEHYIHDHLSAKITDAYIIRPKSKDSKRNSCRTMLQKPEICIKFDFIDIEEMLGWNESGDKKKIEDRLVKIVPK